MGTGRGKDCFGSVGSFSFVASDGASSAAGMSPRAWNAPVTSVT